MTFNWKKTFIAIIDITIAVYLLLAVSAFNTPAEKATVCTEVKIDINNEAIGGFVNPSEIKNILEKNRLYPLAKAQTPGIVKLALKAKTVGRAKAFHAHKSARIRLVPTSP